jgi:hypothetical protein
MLTCKLNSYIWFHYISVRPKVTVDCSSTITLNKGDDITCLCKGEGGKPPANVTWYGKGNIQIGETGKEKQTLFLENVNGTYNGTYTCKAQSHTLTAEESIEMRVRPGDSKYNRPFL